MSETCRTFTHHVGECIRVECTRHPAWIIDVEPQPRDAERTSRQIATAAQRTHEQETDQ